MARYGFKSALLVATLVAIPACAVTKPRPQPHTPKLHVRDQVMVMEKQWRDAAVGGDVATMDRLLSDDFLGITGAGQVVTKAQQLDRMREHTINITRLDMQDSKVKVVGSVAIVTSLAQVEGTNDGQPLRGSFRYTRIYSRQSNGTWKITSYEATRIAPGRQGGAHASGDATPIPGPNVADQQR